MSSLGRPTSAEEWNSFSHDKGKATCLLCGHVVASNSNGTTSSTNLDRHLKKHDLSDDFRQLVLPGSRNDVESRARASASSSAPAKKLATQLMLPTISVPSATISAAVLEMIVYGMLPFTFAANPSLQHLINLFQPSYKVPDRTTFSRKADERSKALLAEEKALFTVHGSRGSSLQVRACVCSSFLSVLIPCHSQFDHWTESVNRKSYITLCASRLDSDASMSVSRTIGTALAEGKDAAGIAADVRTHCAALGIDVNSRGALFVATTDTTAVMPAAVRDLGLLWNPCAAHMFNLVLKHGFITENAPPLVMNLFTRLRALIITIRGSGNLHKLFEHHVNAQQAAVAAAVELHETRTGKKRALPRMLKTYPDTRFNFVYLSVRRALVFWEPLQQFLLQPEVAAVIPAAERVTIDDLPLLQDVCTILREFQSTITSLQASQHPTISASFVSLLLLHMFLQKPIKHTVSGVLQDELAGTKALRECLRDELKRRVLNDDRCVAAT